MSHNQNDVIFFKIFDYQSNQKKKKKKKQSFSPSRYLRRNIVFCLEAEHFSHAGLTGVR